MGIFICPVCGENLDKYDNSFKCINGHSFDISKSGYVNLLLSKGSGKSVHGDNRLMVQARRTFLERNYYQKLRNEFADKVLEYFEGEYILDAGCGEGYYTGAIFDTLAEHNVAAKIYGIDISKIAVEYASKKYRNIKFAAASAFNLPIKDASCDMLVTLFSPYCGKEFSRVLRKNGVMIMVIPSTEHLWEMKKTIYDIPYKNQVKEYALDGFELLENSRITYRIFLENNEDIKALFSMTPYYYRTGGIQQERLYKCETLETTVDFEILVYRKI